MIVFNHRLSPELFLGNFQILITHINGYLFHGRALVDG